MEVIDAIKVLYNYGFSNIELSGGFNYFNNLEDDLIELKMQYNFKYIVHNYFPPPKEPFVLNLASLNEGVYQNTLEHFKKAIKLSKKLGAQKFGFHAGFFLDIGIKEIGKDLSYNELFKKKQCIQRFCEGFNILKKVAGDIELYIENNVISYANLKTFKGVNPFMLTTYREYRDLKETIDFKLLLDIGHLKVSSYSLGLNFNDELDKMISVSDYLHLGNNDGFSDQNRDLLSGSSLLQRLKNYTLRDKIITLEISGKMANIKESYNLLMEAIK